MSRRKTRNRYSVRRTAYIVKSKLMAEYNASWFSAMLTAYSKLDVWASFSTLLYSPIHKFANSVLVYAYEWIYIVNVLFNVLRKEVTRVVPANT